MDRALKEKLMTIYEVLIGLFLLFMTYQVLRYVFGSSWVIEGLMFGLLLANITLTISLGLKLAETRADLRYLKTQFMSLATDFKKHRDEVNNKFNSIEKGFNNMENKLDVLTRKFDNYIKKSAAKSA